MIITPMDIKNRENAYCGVKAWHEAGFKGQGVTCIHLESESSEHGRNCRNRVLEAAPEATVLNASHIVKRNNKEIHNEYISYKDESLPFDEFCTKHNVKILSKSIAGDPSVGTLMSKFYNEQKKKHNLIFFSCAGNEGCDGVTSMIPEDVAILVGACSVSTGKPKMKYYSSLGEVGQVDFSDFTGVQEGTSFSNPYLAGKAALLVGRYGDMSQDEIFEYFKMCAEPIETDYENDDNYEGDYDRYSGYGLVVLPDPKKKYITLKIDNVKYTIDGKEYVSDTAPIIRNNRTFVPIRFIAEALGATIDWDDKTRSITMKSKNKTTKATIGSPIITINGVNQAMDVEPFILNNRTMVPLRFIAESLGCKVGWVESERRVLILEN